MSRLLIITSHTHTAMVFYKKIETWGDTHHPKILDILRILLGCFLVLKGYAFLENEPYLRDIIIQNKVINFSADWIEVLIYYISYAHLVGGVLILLGLFTRLFSLIQIPIVFGAIFFVNIFKSDINSELWLSILTFGLLVMFIVLGSGPWSLDNLILSFRNES